MDRKGSASGLGGSGDAGLPEIGREGCVIPGPWRTRGPSLVEDLPNQRGEIVGVYFPPQPVRAFEERIVKLEQGVARLTERIHELQARIHELEAREMAPACGSRWERLVAVWRGDP